MKRVASGSPLKYLRTESWPPFLVGGLDDGEEVCPKRCPVKMLWPRLRILNIVVKKKLIPANCCSGVEFSVSLQGLFRPHHMTWSEPQQVEFHTPEYLRGATRIVTATRSRIYKELVPTRKKELDLTNAVVWIPDFGTPDGVAEVPLTAIAVGAFRSQLGISDPGPPTRDSSARQRSGSG